MKILTISFIFLLALPALAQDAVQPRWTVAPLATLTGFQVPESVAIDPRDGSAYVTNIVAAQEGEGTARFWADDSTGFISRLQIEDAGRSVKVADLKWLESSETVPMHSLKGALVHEGKLYVADNDGIIQVSLEEGRSVDPARFPVVGASMLNDVTTDGRFLYFSDTGEERIFRWETLERVTAFPAPPSINGLLHTEQGFIAVSWGEHEVYSVDLGEESRLTALGLSDHFTNLDGIVELPDGTLLVSDFHGHKISAISPDAPESVYTLARVISPADIAFDAARSLLYVPSFQADQVLVFRLSKK